MKHPNDPEARPSWLPLVDLRAVTRDSDVIQTTIDVRAPNGRVHPWLIFGALSAMGERQNFLAAFLKEGLVDSEHKSAYALYFDVTHVELVTIRDGMVQLRTWVTAAEEDSSRLRVPSKSVARIEDLGVLADLGNRRSHRIVPFTPPPDVELWKKLRGRELQITIMPPTFATEQD